MEARKFRILFHNTSQGVFTTGSLLDEGNDEGFTYIYAGGSREYGEEPFTDNESYCNIGRVNILTISDFNINHIKRVLQVIETTPVNIIIYPYLAPIQRKIIIREAMMKGEIDAAVIEFLRDPYRFLKKRGIIFVYPLLGNGPSFEGCETGDCHRFEAADSEQMKWIAALEGYVQPVVKAGYILENGWLMFFGCYGIPLKEIMSFSKELEKRGMIDNNRTSPIGKIDSQGMAFYLSKYGIDSFGTIVMYSDANNEGPSADDSMLMIKNMTSLRNCSPVLTPQSEMCSAYCMYKDDHDECKRHNQMNMENHIQGILFMGSLNIGEYKNELIQRFAAVEDRIRFFTVPENGKKKNWDRSLLGWGREGHRKYFIGSALTEGNVIKDIVAMNPHNRFLTLNGFSGVCIFGMLTPLTQERFERKQKEHLL